MSIKTGGCSEDCSYCPQSSRYNTGVKAQKLMNKDAVLEAAQKVHFFTLFTSIFVNAHTALLHMISFSCWIDNWYLAGERGWQHSVLYGCCLERHNRKENQLQSDP